ncbi:2-oxoglutarate dehydrogenase complex dihydrolipoyllysine-residue succinyltransferase [Zooshikella ganghwensis]|uniref:Dihydrolipoyllysine-residue succinyltransferase component of 2-oxoglutarate dehydrogenase complex n=1 Tax=Zooshikella ganghwensis TaxID=202772 RepID=A0A4P9VKK9_9GAMM|nr:2-oxoglutarate dehydrogenase complex dihydrolipoyllysine-residue succinyltransferase [Zooshikella ganghwensis]RDH43783.1 2-oxoglutarate dehydrogenase complex dihydrolipoyllysine-residue succinyltransferase [Zooshikella ganghwensis]
MATEIKAPTFPESVADGLVATWHKQPGDACSRDDLLVDIETDKVVLEVVAPADGVLQEIVKGEGETITSEELIAIFAEGAVASAKPAAPAKAAESASPAAKNNDESPILSPAARRLADEHGIDPQVIPGSGKGGRVTKEDTLKYIESQSVAQAQAAPSAPKPAAVTPEPTAPVFAGERVEKRVPMTRLRARVAQRLVEAQQTAAMLTTFNEVNMQPIMDLRSRYKELFEKKHNGVRLGFMSFFVKAAVEALKRFPAVNASIDGNDIVYHGYQDIGVAVSSDRGLVVPVLRNAENMGLAEIEATIREFGLKARDGKLGIDEMTGGTFTISNGGVFGSLLSTPILNPPQSAILGMHKIQDRPMAVNGKVEILPMMYLALSYDHRLLDGKEAVSFLVTIKELLEDPARMLLDI